MVRDLWLKGFTEKVSFKCVKLNSEGVMDRENGEEKDGLR